MEKATNEQSYGMLHPLIHTPSPINPGQRHTLANVVLACQCLFTFAAADTCEINYKEAHVT